MGWKNWPIWLRGGIIGLIIGIIGAYPVGILIIFALMLISPVILNSILNFTAKLILISDSGNGLAAVASANLGFMIILIIISTCTGIIIGKIKSKKKK